MHDEVRVPADRRREVRVGLRGEAEVAEIRRVVPRFLHRAQQQERDGLLFGLALDPLHESLKVARLHVLGLPGQGIAQRRDELLEDRDLRRVGLFVNAKERRHAMALEMRGHGLIGQQHELLDDPVRDVPLEGDDRFDHALVVGESPAP
jgi:hypothetical protein